jgi:hypothetical protein
MKTIHRKERCMKNFLDFEDNSIRFSKEKIRLKTRIKFDENKVISH